MKALTQKNWDDAYAKGKYQKDSGIAFLDDIRFFLHKEGLEKGQGYYPGAGNGRNLIPLLRSGLRIDANDISPVAVQQLKENYPSAQIEVADFTKIDLVSIYDYVLSIQLFQHTKEDKINELFDQVLSQLKSGGIFALRVNSIHTQIAERHTVVSTNKKGGLNIKYESGQKKGMHIHFYSAEEIVSYTCANYEVLLPLREDFISRADGSYWVQWETILKKV